MSLYVDGELSVAHQGLVREHIDLCARCTNEVEFIEALADGARRVSPAHTPDVANEVIRRRLEGERVVLHTADHRTRFASAPVRAAAAALIFIAATSAYLLLAPSASASRGHLKFDPDAPSAGESIRVTYSPAFYLAEHDSLRLRARARQADSPFPRGGLIGELRISTLRKNAEGEFTGFIQLEPGDVFVAAAVEDFEARDVDTNFGKLWEILVVEDDGDPSIAALDSRYRVLEPYNWVMASAWAEEVTERWPESPFGWTLLYWHDSGLRALEEQDSLRAFHRGKLAELVASTDPDDGAKIALLSMYARLLDQDSLEASLIDQLARLDDSHQRVVDRRTSQALEASGDDPDDLLDRLEGLWRTKSRLSEFPVLLALQTAISVADVDAARRWMERAAATPEVSPGQVLRVTKPLDLLAPERIVLLKEELSRLGGASDEYRSLRRSATQHAVAVQEATSSLSIELAIAYADLGDLQLASRQLARFSDQIWRPTDLQLTIDFHLAAGDTISALDWIGLLVVDPIDGAEKFDSYSDILVLHIAELQAFLARSREALASRITKSLTLTVQLSPRTELLIAGDTRRWAGEFFEGRPTVLLLIDGIRAGTTSIADFERIRNKPQLVNRVRALVVVSGTRDLDSGSPTSTSLPLVIDEHYDLVQDLRVFGTPVYVVLDAHRNVVADLRDPATAFRIAHALVEER